MSNMTGTLVDLSWVHKFKEWVNRDRKTLMMYGKRLPNELDDHAKEPCIESSSNETVVE